MHRRRGRRPQLELLEGRSVPSFSPFASPVTQVASLINKPEPIAINGQISGTALGSSRVPDVGSTQTIRATGQVRPLGKVTAGGVLALTGFIARGRAHGRLTLSGPQGNVALTLTGPRQPGFASAPSTLKFTVAGGIHKYANATGHGTVTLVETAIPGAGGPANTPSPAGQTLYALTLTLHTGRGGRR